MSKKEQTLQETSPLTIAIIAALDPWPSSHYRAYAIVDELLEESRLDAQGIRSVVGRRVLVPETGVRAPDPLPNQGERHEAD